MMSTFSLAILLLSLIFEELFFITRGIKKNAYLWWYTPWIAFLYTAAAFLIYFYIDLPKTVLLSWIPYEYAKEAFFCLACMMAWKPLQFFLRRQNVYTPMLALYRRLFADQKEENAKVPFPYYYSLESKSIKSRVGRQFYRLTLKIAILILTLGYAIALLVAHFLPGLFFPVSAFGILALIPMTEYFLYLSSGIEEGFDIEIEKGGTFRADSDMDFLWQLYIENFDNYSIAWKRDYSVLGTKRQMYEKNDIASFDNLFREFKNRHRGGIIEDCDLLTAFSKLVPFFLHVIKEGHYILVAFDVPNLFSSTRQNSYIEEIAHQLETVLVKRFPKINEIIRFKVYDEKSTLDVFDNSIVLSPLSVLARQDMKDKEWMSNLGLITVVNAFDRGMSSLYENRRFSYLLKAVNQDYQIIVISDFRKDLEASLEQTWVTTQEKHFYEGCKMVLYPRSDRQYFIGYNFEDYEERFNKVMAAHPNDKLYSGSEMLVFPLTSKLEDEDKVVTPLHQLELAYTNAIEGNEEIRKFLTYFKKRYSISAEDAIHKVKAHVLPTDEIIEPQVLSVIYDKENNVATEYLKWIHLGYSENFSIVISKPYLFRDYFNANHHFFIHAPFTALQPCMCKSRITLALILLDMLKDGEQEENTIKHHLLKYYAPEEVVSVPDILRNLFSTYFSDDLAKNLRTKNEVVFDGKSFQTQVKFCVVHPDSIHLPYLDTISVKDENGNVLFSILADLLYQNYNRGQHHSFSGLPYTIADFDPVNKTLNVRRSKELSNELFYKQCHKIKVEFNDSTLPLKSINMKEPIVFYHEMGAEMAYMMKACETHIVIEPQKWITFEKRYEAPKYSGGSSKIVTTDEEVTPRRVYEKGKVLKLSLKYLPGYKSRIDDVRRMMQILIYEGLQSLFPHHALYLIVTSIGCGDPNLPWIFHEFQCNEREEDGWLSFYFIEDAHIDLGLIGGLTYDNIKYLMRYIFDYLLWLTEESIQPGDYIEYRINKKRDKLAFLKYGNGELPEYFDIDLAINFIRDQFFNKADNPTQMQRERQENNSLLECCDFCGVMMKSENMQRLSDGRMRCPNCSENAIDSVEQFQKLCAEVKEAFLCHLGIDMNQFQFDSIMVGAVTLHKLRGSDFAITKSYDVRKLIGLACDKDVDTIYVEDGYKREQTFGIIAHEMTHVWEFNSQDFQKMRQTNGDWVEGLAVWTDLYLCEKNGFDVEPLRKGWLMRDDEYGRGLRLIMNTCPTDPYGYIRKQANTC